MFNPKTPDEKSGLDQAIETVLSEMAGVMTDSDEYAKMVDQLTKLYALKEIDSPDRRISPDTLATISANILGILIIVSHERAHIVTSKALTFIQKLR